VFSFAPSVAESQGLQGATKNSVMLVDLATHPQDFPRNPCSALSICWQCYKLSADPCSPCKLWTCPCNFRAAGN